MTEAVLPFVTLAYLVAMGLCGLRLLSGPQAEDRVLALDTLYIMALALIAVLSIGSGHPINFEGVLAIAMVGFVGTIAAARFLTRSRGANDAGLD
ncbi:K+/H+ antiporter subunit F [Niveibacterium umoris]|uniref:Multicomponent K+:H+ antiporter subunit F n=1 Tax=Niveibacterium umoris TaxID=1193620 RepID=A0A840BGQ2_9RHOO|nr:monovalent cation/H+ antiporter complex subunit F [Niveibacterium umoris]MBB4012345.1 multicomponent K+:H+ antiporter subunit F [Niveibacterium umoris]